MPEQPMIKFEIVGGVMDEMAKLMLERIMIERMSSTAINAVFFEHTIPSDDLKAYFGDSTLRRQCKCPMGCRLALEQSCGWYSCDGCGKSLEDTPRHCCAKHDFNTCQDCLEGYPVLEEPAEKPGMRRVDAHKTKHTRRADRSGFGGKHPRSRHAKWAFLVE